MNRDKALRIVLVTIGLLFVAAIYPLVRFREDEALQMMLSIYVTLGAFLLIASRNPAAHKSLIAFAAWSSFAHGAVMAVQAIYDPSERIHFLTGAVALIVIGLPLVGLAPRKASAAAA